MSSRVVELMDAIDQRLIKASVRGVYKNENIDDTVDNSVLPPQPVRSESMGLIKAVGVKTGQQVEERNRAENVLSPKESEMWQAKGMPADLTLDFGSVTAFAQVFIKWNPKLSRTGRFELQFSDDGKLFVNTFGGNQEGAVTSIVEFSPAMKARFIKVLCYGNAENNENGILAIRAKGAKTNEKARIVAGEDFDKPAMAPFVANELVTPEIQAEADRLGVSTRQIFKVTKQEKDSKGRIIESEPELVVRSETALDSDSGPKTVLEDIDQKKAATSEKKDQKK